MRRILLICTSAALLLPAAAGSAGAAARPTHGFLVVRNGSGDGGVHGHAVVTIVVQGFVVGRVSQKAEARIDVYHLQTSAGGGGSQAAGSDVSHRPVRWRKFTGVEYRGSGFRFRAIGGWYRVVVRGAGLYIFAGGRGRIWLHGSSFDRLGDGTYALDGGAVRSLPTQLLKLPLGRG